VARKIITDTIHTTMIPNRKRRMMYLFISLDSAYLPWVLSRGGDLLGKTHRPSAIETMPSILDDSENHAS
jgi:hypothetical protein